MQGRRPFRQIATQSPPGQGIAWKRPEIGSSPSPGSIRHQWKAARTTNAIECLDEEFRRRIKTQTVLPCAETVPMLLWALVASGQITMRKVDGWQTLDKPIEPMTLDLPA